MKVRNSITIATSFIWIGFICAISFMEAWLKFKAPGATFTSCLAIGKLVFTVLNKVELVLAVVIVISYLPNRAKYLKAEYTLIITILLLLIQTSFLLPKLTQQIDTILSGKSIEPTQWHRIYVLMEIFKVFFLTIYGFKQLQNEIK